MSRMLPVAILAPGHGHSAALAEDRRGRCSRSGAFGGGAVRPDYPAAGQSHLRGRCCPG